MVGIVEVEVGVQRRRVLTGKREYVTDLDLRGGRTPIIVLGGITEQVMETGLLQNLNLILVHTELV